jgi:hypothetical protein
LRHLISRRPSPITHHSSLLAPDYWFLCHLNFVIWPLSFELIRAVSL